MKTIGIDARLLFQTGVGTYVQNLLHYLSDIQNDTLVYKVYVLEQDIQKAQKWFPAIHFTTTQYRWHTFSEQLGFGLQLVLDNLDLMHFTYFGHPVWYPRKFISTVHDLTPLVHITGRASTKGSLAYFWKHTVYRFVLGNQIYRSKCVITPSETVREQIRAYYGEAVTTHVEVAKEGVSFRLGAFAENELRPLIDTAYYLYVGNYYPHKNVQSLLRAFLNSTSRKKLVLTGPDDFFLKQIYTTMPEVQKTQQIVFVTSPSVQDVAALYMYCDALINPSLSEGFGLPLAEASYFHKPVIASEIPVFRELLGNTLYAFDPYSISSMSDTIERFENEKKHVPAKLMQPMSFLEMTKKIHEIYLTYA